MLPPPINIIITGSTGMVGEGVLHECLLSPNIGSILVINRKPCGVTHPKLKEIVHADFFDLAPIEAQMAGYDACFYCLGVSSVGMNADKYYQITYTLTMNFAQTLLKYNKAMTFCYVSGAGTDGTEQGRIRWARVKGKVENDLMKLPFKAAYNFRPAFMLPTKGLKNALPSYKYVTWLYPVLRPLFPNYFHTLKELGLAMINCAVMGYDNNVLEARDIVGLAKKTSV